MNYNDRLRVLSAASAVSSQKRGWWHRLTIWLARHGCGGSVEVW